MTASFTVYQLPTGPVIKRLSDGAMIPADPANKDYQAYLAAVQAGGTATNATVNTVPQAVTAFQAQAALATLAGAEQGQTMLDDVNAWVASQPVRTQLAWNKSATVARTSDLIIEGAAHFGWSSAFLDQLFTTASTIAA